MKHFILNCLGFCALLLIQGSAADLYDDLMYAAKNGKLNDVKSLIERGANVNGGNNIKWTPLMEASKYGHTEIVKHLIEKGADVNAGNEIKWSPLHEASKFGFPEIVKILLDKGANPNVGRDGDSWRPLHEAAKFGQLEVARLLLDKGAKPNDGNNGNWRPLHESAKFGHLQVTRLLIEKGANPNYGTSDNWKPLHEAAKFGHVDIVRLLLEKRANPNDGRNGDDWKPLHEAAKFNHSEIVRLLLKKGAVANDGNNDGWRPLHEAAKFGNYEVAKLLIENGAKVNDGNEAGWRPLHEAAKYGKVDIVKLLLVSGANGRTGNNDNWTPLDEAKKNGQTEIVKLLSNIMRPAELACESNQTTKILNERILDGDNAELGEFPWMAALGYIDAVTNKVSFDCGGTIISDHFILTAAHCVKERQRPVTVRMGQLSLSENNYDDSQTNNRRIQEIYRHPQYSTTTKRHDIALIRVAEIILFSDNIRPACLHTDARDLASDVELTVTGWGSTSSERTTRSDKLLKAQLKSMPLTECSTKLSEYNKGANFAALKDGLIDGQYCALDPQGNSDSCSGDSGGPLQYLNPNTFQINVLGVVSYGVGCGGGLPSIYTRVAHYLDWIEPIVWSPKQA